MSEAGIIEVRGLHKTYQMGNIGVPALRGVDLHVERGDFLTIVGP
jgi:putative ABC transport system ATP-binding protein